MNPILFYLRKLFRPKRKIKAFIITFNEAPIIELTIQHYQKFCSEIYIYDNYSTDQTKEICRSMGCYVELFGTEGVLDDRTYLEIKNNIWQKHRDADYVIVCDADEIITVPDILEEDLYQSTGYNMYSETIPSSWDEITKGYPDVHYNKVLLFNPSKVKAINYDFGCHSIKPVFFGSRAATINTNSIILKHMRYIGGVERMIDRYKVYSERMCDFNKQHDYGFQYHMAIEEIKNNWEQVKQKSDFIPGVLK